MIEIEARHTQGTFTLDVALSVPETGVTALFGPSGSGKTSLLNMIAGLTRPDAGRVEISERTLFDSVRGIDLPPEARRVGYIFQEGRLFPHMTVRGNLDYGRRRAPAAERYVEFDQVVALLGIGGLMDRRPAGLSGGEKQRVAIGRALLANPRVLLMDENEELGGHLRFSGDGEAGRTRVDAWRESLTRGGATVLTQTAVIGHYQNHWLSAVRGNRLYKIRAGAVVVATGAFEIPMVFDGNDRPGVLLGTAVQRLVRMHGVAPGRRAVIVTASDAGWDVAADLVEAGVEVAALADERPGLHADQRLDTSGAQILQGYTIGAAYGRRAVRAALLVPVGGDGPRHSFRLARLAFL